jgi:protein-tyrosine-phosphatase
MFGDFGRSDESFWHGFVHAFILSDSLLSLEMFYTPDSLKGAVLVHSEELPEDVDGTYLDQVCSKTRLAIPLQWGIKFHPLIGKTIKHYTKQYPDYDPKDVGTYVLEAFFNIVRNKVQKCKNPEALAGFIEITLLRDANSLLKKQCGKQAGPIHFTLDQLEDLPEAPYPFIDGLAEFSKMLDDPIHRFVAEHMEKSGVKIHEMIKSNGDNISLRQVQRIRKMCREQYSKYTSCEFCEQVADAMSKSYALRKDRWPSWCVYDPEYEKMQKELENEQKKIDEACRFSESETLLSYMVRARIFLTLDGNFLNKNFLRGEP